MTYNVQPLCTILLRRKTRRVEAAYQYKVNGPVGISISISATNGVVYIKGTCVQANLSPEHLLRYEMTNDYLLNKDLSIKINGSTEELVHKLQFPYWKPIPQSNDNLINDFLIKKPPSYCLLSITHGIPNFPRSPSSSELIISVDTSIPNSFLVKHLYSLPPSLNSLINNPVHSLNSIFYSYGSSSSLDSL